MAAAKIALSVVGLAGAAAKATGWGAVATACELALKAADVDRAIRDIPVDPVRAALHRVSASLSANLAKMQRRRRGSTAQADETEAILFALDRALATRVPSVGRIAQADLDFPALRRQLLDEIATAEPAFFAPDRPGTQVLAQLLSTAFDALAKDTRLAEAMRIPVAAETLQRLTALQNRLDELPDEVAERVVALLEKRSIGARAEQAGLERQAMLRIARRVKPDELLDFDQAVVEVEHAVEIALDAIARGERRGNLETFVEDILSRLATTTRAGEFDRGSRTVDDALRDLDRQEAEHQAAICRSRVALLEAGIEQDTLRHDAVGVARRIESQVALAHPGDHPAWTPAFRQRWDRLYEEGRDKGINFSLEIAAALVQRMLDATHDAGERGAAGNLLGNTLATLGMRESGIGRLEQAVNAYRAALQENRRERVPLDWALTQNNLGNALAILGERESGTTRLEQAVDAYRAALEERAREHVPLDWAITQNNLGIALQTLGERESGTARLEQAVDAYRAALREYTRERVPLDWAMTQNNLGTALQTLGDRASSIALLKQAVAAYHAVLLEYTRERVPLDWAMTQNNLGNVLLTLGERESGTTRLEQAADAYRAAQEEYTRERVPLHWAKTQNNLGIALHALGERESSTARLEQAVDAFHSALEERMRERMPLHWAQTQNNLGNALRALGERESSTARLEQAVEALHSALEERTRERVPLNWATTQNNLGAAFAKLGERESGAARLEQAVAAYRAALQERTRERAPLDWAYSQHGLADTLALLASRAHDSGQMAVALKAMRDATEGYRQANDSYQLPIAEQRVSEIATQLAAMQQ
jgi:tetratricopeptide (TPR) repeat protein